MGAVSQAIVTPVFTPTVTADAQLSGADRVAKKDREGGVVSVQCTCGSRDHEPWQHDEASARAEAMSDAVEALRAIRRFLASTEGDKDPNWSVWAAQLEDIVRDGLARYDDAPKEASCPDCNDVGLVSMGPGLRGMKPCPNLRHGRRVVK